MTVDLTPYLDAVPSIVVDRISTDSHSTSATTRVRENPSARSAAISPSRWLTETVSSTVMRSSANPSVTVVRTAEICWK